MESKKTQFVLVCLFVGSLCLNFAAVSQAATTTPNGNICKRELENSNRTLAKWAENMESMVNESNLPSSVRETVHAEANAVLDMIEDFGRLVEQPNQSANQLARELVNIRRRSNRLALDIYLNTFDMRWPQTSVQLGVIVERVQQACLDRATIQALESPPNPLNELGIDI